MDEAFRISLTTGTAFSLAIASAMWGVTSIQAVSYYHNFKTDPLYLRFAIGFLWLFETLFVILQAGALYDLIHHTGTSMSVPLKMYVGAVFASVIQCTVQITYAIRIYKVWGKIYISLLCWVGSIYGFSAGLAFYFLTINNTVERFLILEKKYNWLLSSWYSVTATVDIIITLTMCYLLRKDRDQIRKRTLRILDKLVLWTIQTGTVTSLMAIATVATYDTVPSPGVWIALSIVVTTLYPLTLVVLLNGRSLLRTMDGNTVDMFTALKPAHSTEVSLGPQDELMEIARSKMKV